MSRKYSFKDPDKLYFISFATVECVDIFTRPEYRDIIIESWKYCQANKGLDIYSWALMTNHIHMIIGSHKDPLAAIVRDMKAYTSTRIHKVLSDHTHESRKDWMLELFTEAGKQNSNNNKWQLWLQHNKPIEIVSPEMFYQKMEYIHRNPVKAGFVEHEEDWLYSSARDFHGKKGLIELSYII